MAFPPGVPRININLERVPCPRAIEAPLPKCQTVGAVVTYMEDIGITKVIGQMITEYNNTHSIYEFHATSHTAHEGCDGKCAAAFFCIMPCGPSCDAAACLYYERTGSSKPEQLLRVDKDTVVPKLPVDGKAPSIKGSFAPIYHKGTLRACDIFLEFPGVLRRHGDVYTSQSKMAWTGSKGLRFKSRYAESNLSLPGCLATISGHYRYFLDLGEHLRVAGRRRELDAIGVNSQKAIRDLEAKIERNRLLIEEHKMKAARAERNKAKFLEANEKRQQPRAPKPLRDLADLQKRKKKAKPAAPPQKPKPAAPSPKAKSAAPPKRKRAAAESDEESKTAASDDDDESDAEPPLLKYIKALVEAHEAESE